MKPEEMFHFRDGSKINSLDGLRDKIERISYSEFYHHVNNSRNDFANWIRYVLKDEKLADELEKVQSIVETVEIINDYLQPKRGGMQSKIEEQLHIDLPEPETEVITQEPEIEAQDPVYVQDEEPEQESEQQGQETQEESHHYIRSAVERDELDHYHHDLDRVIVKDFIWGLIFGLVVGFILARVLVI